MSAVMCDVDLERELPVDEAPEVARDWPAWQVPASALREWLVLRAALVELLPRVPVCSVDPEAWWVAGTSPVRVAEAVQWCGACPLLGPCRTYALAADERQGVWGGTTPTERRRMAGRQR